ncbi:MAG: hypothetical protein LH467_00870, partial [Gemmatimonadaceae bacterium]|nr:hypothetical protein [Gemmatimonadaceae bacterium]
MLLKVQRSLPHAPTFKLSCQEFLVVGLPFSVRSSLASVHSFPVHGSRLPRVRLTMPLVGGGVGSKSLAKTGVREAFAVVG